MRYGQSWHNNPVVGFMTKCASSQRPNVVFYDDFALKCSKLWHDYVRQWNSILPIYDLSIISDNYSSRYIFTLA